DADLAKLRDDTLAARIERGHGRHPVYVEPVRKSRLAHQLLRSLDVALELGPLDRILHVVVDPVARRLAQSPRLRFVHGPFPAPPAPAWWRARRSMARLTASRTRLSRNGFLGSWNPGNSSHQDPESTGASMTPGSLPTLLISSPGTK